MSGSASFVTQIVESAGARGVALSPEDIESINENLGLITGPGERMVENVR